MTRDPLQTLRFVHEVPEGVDTHHITPKKCLRTIYTHPYLLTIDIAGAVTHLWSMEFERPVHLTTLDPPLPGNTTSGAITTTKDPQMGELLMIVGRCWVTDEHEYDKAGLLRIYHLETGKLLQDLELPNHGSISCISFKQNGDVVAVTCAEGITLYKRSSDKYQEIKRVIDPGWGLSHVFDDSTLLTAESPDDPSDTLSLVLRPLAEDQPRTQVTLPPAKWGADSVDVDHVKIISTSRVAIAVTERIDYSNEQSTVYVLEIPSLSIVWSQHFEFEIRSISCHESLGMLVAISAPAMDDDSGVYRTNIRFLDLESGSVAREESFSQGPYHGIITGCTTSDMLVVVMETGAISMAPLKEILEIGLQAKSEEGAIITRDVDVDSNLYTRGDTGWIIQTQELHYAHWVSYAVLTPFGVFLFPLTGQDILFVRW